MKTLWPMAAVLLLGLLFHSATVSSYHSWGDDFAQYILHARNIAEGIPYADTGYLQNPVDAAQQDVGPRMYPPLMPLLLSFVYRVSGNSLTAMKNLQAVILVLAAFLAVLYFQASGRLQRSHAPLLLAVFVFHPFFWEAKEYISSDLLFVAVLFAALLLLERMLTGATSARMVILLGVTLYACVATRTVGIVMLAVAGAMALLHRDRAGKLLAAVGICVLLMGAQTLLISSDNSYVRFLASQASLQTSLQNLIDYTKEFSAAWKGGLPLRATQGLYLLSLPVVLAGVVVSLRKRVAAVDLFAASYTAVILVWPSFQGVRFLLPLLPVYLLYLWTGAARLHRHAATGLAVLLLLISAAYYWTRPAPAPDSGVTQSAFADLSRNLQRISSPEDRFLFRKPRALAWMADRPAAVYNTSRDEALFRSLLQQLNIRYIVKANLPEEDFRADREILGPLLDAHPEAFSSIYNNGRFEVFRVNASAP